MTTPSCKTLDGRRDRGSSSRKTSAGSQHYTAAMTEEFLRSTPTLSPSKSLASSPSLPTTPLSTSTTVPSSPEVEIARRPRISGAPSRAFGLALAGAFKSKPKVTPERPKPNQMLVEIQDEEEPLIDLSGSWQKNPVKDLDQFVVTVKSVSKPLREADTMVNKTPTTGSILSPWSKPFNPRREDGHVSRHSLDQPVTGFRRSYPPAVSSAMHSGSRMSESIFRMPPSNRALHAVPQPIGGQLSAHSLELSGRSLVEPSADASHPASLPAPIEVPLFTPRAAKLVSIRAPTSSPTQSPDTPSKVKPGSLSKSLVLTRIALPYEDDYDSDEDPFYPVATNSHRGRDESLGPADSADQKAVKGLELQLDGEQEHIEEGVEHSRGDGVAERVAPVRCSSPKPQRLASLTPLRALSLDQCGSIDRDSVMEARDVASVTVPQQTSIGSCMTIPTAPPTKTTGSSIGLSALPRTAGDYDTVPIPSYRARKQDVSAELKSSQSSRSYDFTFCRAHLGELSCPYGKYCCFKHPPMQEPISSEQLAQLEHGLSRKEQEKVNFGKIRGLLTTRSITITPDDGTALIVLYADAVCENAGSRSDLSTFPPVLTESPGVNDSFMEASSNHALVACESPKLRPESSALQPATAPSPSAGDDLAKGITASITSKLRQISARDREDLGTRTLMDLEKLGDNMFKTERGICDQVMIYRHPPPDQEDID